MWNYSTTDFNEFYILRENESAASLLLQLESSRSFNKELSNILAIALVWFQIRSQHLRKE
jgi:hypothetical protein